MEFHVVTMAFRGRRVIIGDRCMILPAMMLSGVGSVMIVGARAGGIFPLRFGRQAFTSLGRICGGVMPADTDHRMIQPVFDRGTRSLRLTPVGTQNPLEIFGALQIRPAVTAVLRRRYISRAPPSLHNR